MESVYLVWGSEAIELVYDVLKRDSESLHRILEAVEVYDFDTVEEAEAFRFGLCEATRCVEDARNFNDFAEIPEGMYRSLSRLFKRMTKKIA